MSSLCRARLNRLPDVPPAMAGTEMAQTAVAKKRQRNGWQGNGNEEVFPFYSGDNHFFDLIPSEMPGNKKRLKMSNCPVKAGQTGAVGIIAVQIACKLLNMKGLHNKMLLGQSKSVKVSQSDKINVP